MATYAQEPSVNWGHPMVRLPGGGCFKPFGAKGGVKKLKMRLMAEHVKPVSSKDVQRLARPLLRFLLFLRRCPV